MRAIFYSFIAVVILVSCSSGEDKKEKTGKEVIVNKQVSPESKSVNNQEKTIVSDSISGLQKEDSLVKKDTQTSEPKFTSSKMKKIPTKEKLNTDKLARKYIRKGLTYFQNKNYEQGIEEFEMVIKLKPSNAKAYYHIGMGKYQLKDYYGALDALTTATGLNPQDTVGLVYAGLSKYYLGDFYGAIRFYDKAINNNPDYEYAYFNRGTAKVKIDDYEGAITDFNRAIFLKPDYFEAYNNRGNTYYYLKQIEHACSDWKKAKELGATGVDEILEKLCK